MVSVLDHLLGRSQHCTKANNNKCIECSDGFKPSEDGLSCIEQMNYGLTVGLPVSIVSFIVILIVIFIIIVFIFVMKTKEKKKHSNFNLFTLKKSNIAFVHLSEGILSNKESIHFNEEFTEIPVNEETREIICIGNNKAKNLKVQFSIIEGNDRYEMRTEPQLANIPKGYACEFEIFIKPLCSFDLEEKIALIVYDMKKNENITHTITLTAVTQTTTRLDYHELQEEKKLGEGSFGI